MLEKIKKRVNIPVVGIGGINAENAGLLKKTGIDGISVISAILGRDDIENAAGILRNIWNT
jgi:thiamine-phosphate pyrophosphorylase